MRFAICQPDQLSLASVELGKVPMFRYLLTAYLGFAALAGSSLCCCTVSYLHSAICGSPDFPLIGTSFHKCCGHHQSSSPVGNQDRPGDPASCPCKQQGEVQGTYWTVTTPMVHAFGLDELTFEAAVGVGEWPVTAIVNELLQHSRFRQFPSLSSGREILRSHSILRC